MQKVRFINSKGESIYFDIKPPFVLQGIDGVGQVEANLYSQKSPYQDGATYINSKLETRDIFMRVSLVNSNEQELFKMRQDLQRVFNPKLGQGYLIYETPNDVKMLICVPDGTPSFGSYKPSSVACQINLTAFNPLWTDVSDLVEGVSVSNYIVKYDSLPTIPHFTARIEKAGTIVTNNGTFNTPMIIEVSGEITTNVKIMNNTTGEILKINRVIPVGSILRIDTSFGRNRVAKLIAQDGTESNGFPYISFDSDFPQLELGDNIISYESLEDVIINVKWHNNYIGL